MLALSSMIYWKIKAFHPTARCPGVRRSLKGDREASARDGFTRAAKPSDQGRIVWGQV